MLPDSCGSNSVMKCHAPSDEEENTDASYAADKDMPGEEANEVAELEDTQ